MSKSYLDNFDVHELKIFESEDFLRGSCKTKTLTSDQLVSVLMFDENGLSQDLLLKYLKLLIIISPSSFKNFDEDAIQHNENIEKCEQIEMKIDFSKTVANYLNNKRLKKMRYLKQDLKDAMEAEKKDRDIVKDNESKGKESTNEKSILSPEDLAFFKECKKFINKNINPQEWSIVNSLLKKESINDILTVKKINKDELIVIIEEAKDIIIAEFNGKFNIIKALYRNKIGQLSTKNINLEKTQTSLKKIGKYIVAGKSFEEICDKLDIDYNVLYKHINILLKKLGK